MSEEEVGFAELLTAAAKAVDEPEPVMVTQMVTVCAYVDADGQQSYSILSNCEQLWQTMGLLHYGLTEAENRIREDDE